MQRSKLCYSPHEPRCWLNANFHPPLKMRQNPMLEWTFDKDLLDSTGSFPLTTIGNAKVEHGALLVDGQSAAKTSALPKALKAKTIEAWVQLDTLDTTGWGSYHRAGLTRWCL